MVWKMISSIPILIFYVSTSIASSDWPFCANGAAHELKCPEGSIVTGIQTTSELFSTDAAPVCSEMADEILTNQEFNPHYYTEHFFNHPGIDDFIFPVAFCRNDDFAIESLSICFQDGGISEISFICSRLKYVESNNDVYTVVGKPDSPELKCEQGSLLLSIGYNRSDDGNLVAIAKCTAMNTEGERVSVFEKRENCTDGEIFEVACPDGHVLSGFESTGKIFTTDSIPVCSKTNPEITPDIQVTNQAYFFGSDPDVISAECNSDNPIMSKLSMCFVDGVITASTTECRRFEDPRTIMPKINDLIHVKDSDGSELKCPRGFFLQKFWRVWKSANHDTYVTYGYCVCIIE